MKRIGIIGAGPSGILAAIAASKNPKNKITIIEKNEKICKKLYITGKGRCNITNASDISEFFENVTTNKNFMYSSFYTFTNDNIIELLEENNLRTKIERGNRVFPESDKSSDVIKVFNKLIREKNIKLKLDTNVSFIEKKDGIFYVYSKDEKFEFDNLIIATGGASYNSTGSTGDGYKFAKTFGHEVKDIKPALIPIELKNNWLKELQGLSLKNIELVASRVNGKIVNREFGELLFTHFGISGPVTLTMSNYINKYDAKDIELFIDLKPGLTYEKLDKRLLRDFEEFTNKQFKNSLDLLLPKKLIPIIIENSNIDPEKTVHQITKEEREALTKAIKNFNLDFSGFRNINYAIITSGGINVDEINPSTMESKIIEGLYFVGETIDVEALTGGYNLQIAYSTGYLAGISLN